MASANIQFDEIRASIRKPGKYFEFNTKLAVRTLPTNDQRVLLIGQRLASGSVAELTATQVFSDAEAAAYFGEGSMLHRMARAAMKAYPYIDITCIALDDAAAGIAASATATLTGPASGSGVVTLRIGTELVQVAVASGDTATEIAAALKAQADQQTDLPVALAAAAGVLTITARHKGIQGNSIKLAASSTAAGVTAVATAMTGGLVDPSIANLLALVADAGHNLLITPYTDQVNMLTLTSAPGGVQGAAMLASATTGGTDAETDAGLLARLLDVLQSPPAGGNKADWRRWALEVDGVSEAYVFPLRRGLGTVDVCVTSAGGAPSAEILEATRAHLDAERPAGAADFAVLAPSLVPVAVTVAVALSGLTLAQAQTAVETALSAYFATLEPGDTAYLSRIETAVSGVSGVVDRRVASPAGNTAAGAVQWLRLGTVNVELLP